MTTHLDSQAPILLMRRQEATMPLHATLAGQSNRDHSRPMLTTPICLHREKFTVPSMPGH